MKKSASIPAWLASLLIAAPVVFCLAPRPASGQEAAKGGAQFTIKLAAVAPEGTSWADTGFNFRKYVEEKTGGKVRVIWYLGGIMGDEPDVFLKMRLGYLQGGGFTSGGLGKMVPETQILGLPFLFRDYDEIDYVLNKLNPRFQKLFEEQGFILSGWLEAGRHYWFTQKPAENINDFKNSKIWAWKYDPVNIETHQALGFQLFPVGFPKLYDAIQAGQLDAFYSPLYAAAALQWYVKSKYLIDLPFSYAPAAIVMDKKFLSSLPPQFQQVIKEAWDLYLPPLKKIIRSDNEKALKGFASRGMKVVKLSDETVQAIKDKTYPIYQEQTDKLYPSWLLAGVLSALNEYRKTP